MEFTKEQLKEINLSIIPFTTEVLTATTTHVLLRELYSDEEKDDQHCIVKIKRSYFNTMIKLWLDAKAEYLKNWKEFCGVFGNFAIEEVKFVGEGTLQDWEDDGTENGKYVIHNVPIFDVVSFDKHCDMEHG